jgi:hypothetical protein
MRLALVSLASVFFASTAFAQSSPPAAAPAAAPPAAPPAAAPAPPSADVHFDVATLRSLRERGIITQAELDTALRDMNESTGADVAAEAPTFVIGKFSTTFYGQMKTDLVYDSTESFTDLAGNVLVARPANAPLNPPPLPLPSNIPATYSSNYAGQNPQVLASDRDSRFGFHLRAPETHGVRVSGLFEMDFFGGGTTSVPSGTSQSQYFSSAVPRLRHAYFRVETPVVDLLVGQYWHLFGWQNFYHPGSVQAQGLVGELYSRDVQVRLSKTIKTDPINVDIAVAALRPPESAAAIPQLEAGVRMAINNWTGVMTNGASGTSMQPASIGVSGNYRNVVIPALMLPGASDPTTGVSPPIPTVNLAMESIAADAYVPIIPVSKGHRANALSVHGEYVYGQGIADLYTGLTGGIVFPFLTNTTAQNPAPVYSAPIDNGLVAFDSNGNLHYVEWTSMLAGLQYYLPIGEGRVFIVGNYGHMESNNTSQFVAARSAIDDPTSNHQNVSGAGVRKSIDLIDGSLFVDAWTGVRFGVEGAYYMDHYVDGVTANNVRIDVGGLFIF